MSRGVVLFAFNNETVNYYDTAVYCAKRIKHFLNLPVSLITDEKSLPDTPTSLFDNIILAEAQTGNRKTKDVSWINKGRYRVYDLTPYDETLVLDTDYIVNSNQLNQIFDLYDDFMCAKTANYLMFGEMHKDVVSQSSFELAWATIICFKKTQRTKQIFECMQMIQDNYLHYSNLYSFVPAPYRNDYALAISLHIVNGGLDDKSLYIPWNLIHVNERINLHKVNEEEFDTEFIALKQSKRNEYIKIKETDFHMLDKKNYLEIVYG